MKFIIFYNGPLTPPDASHAGWITWFKNLGSALVDKGSPLSSGSTVRADGSTAASAITFNGYSIIQAKDKDAALALVSDHPYLKLGDDYTIEIFQRG